MEEKPNNTSSNTRPNPPTNRQAAFTRPTGNDTPSHRGGPFHGGGQSSGKMQTGSIQKKFDDRSIAADSPPQQNSYFPGVKSMSSDIGSLNWLRIHLSDGRVRNIQGGKTSHTFAQSHSASQIKQPCVVSTAMRHDSSHGNELMISRGPSTNDTQCSTLRKINIGGSLGPSNSPSGNANFDICQQKTGTPFQLKAPLIVKNREKRNEIKRTREGHSASILRPGVVLLKSYLLCEDQVKIVKTCWALGLGSGGFYQPGYRGGVKLRLKMMCLGKNWDPETSTYMVM